MHEPPTTFHDVNARMDEMRIGGIEYAYLVGSLAAADPEAVNDALDRLETHRQATS